MCFILIISLYFVIRQAVDRAFRIGQKKDVIVYRMIMAASVEEKMYEKQVFKDGLRIVTERGKSSIYFAEKDQDGLFQLGSKGMGNKI